MLKQNFAWAWSMWAGTPGLVRVPCIVEIDRIVIREVQYQLEVNRFRNEEVIVKGNFEWVWPMWAGPWDRVVIRDWARSMWTGRPRIDRIVIRDVQYQFEVNRCRNEEVNIKIPNSDSARVGRDSGQDRRTDSGDQYNIPTLLKACG
ncbi:hypothetical protein DPMN_150264 [Dreissena polymorpha]|uniref:Uncharacterized protein n=1 Tax=Dreissena polymorpha TaxID=45954 RepID=A0A9D4FHN0_DREPO|nr:hypothetical protein DPMN_150264 [Dreissena polymorpha]